MLISDIQGNHTIQESVAGHATAGTADEFVVAVVPFRATVTGVTFTPNAAINGADTNYFSGVLYNRGAAGAGSTAVATLAFTSGVNATALVPKVIPLGATVDVEAGDVLVFEKDVTGTGLAMPDGLVTITIKAR